MMLFPLSNIPVADTVRYNTGLAFCRPTGQICLQKQTIKWIELHYLHVLYCRTVDYVIMCSNLRRIAEFRFII